MPVYEYECDSCRLHFERRQRYDDEPVALCPNCEGKARRVIHSVPVIFKGSGFYVTDHRSSSAPGVKREAAKATGEEKSDTQKTAAVEAKSGQDK